MSRLLEIAGDDQRSPKALLQDVHSMLQVYCRSTLWASHAA